MQKINEFYTVNWRSHLRSVCGWKFEVISSFACKIINDATILEAFWSSYLLGYRQIPKNMILNAYKCTICNLVKKYGVKEKFRISHVPTAQLLLDAAAAKQDDVHVRFADLQTPERLIAADMYCHSNCKRAFLHEFTEQNSACVFSDEKLSSSFKKALDLATVKSILKGATKNWDEDLIQNFSNFTTKLQMSYSSVCIPMPSVGILT